MKFAKKVLIVFIYTFISFISQMNYGLCSDNGPVITEPVESVPVTQSQQQVPNAAVSTQQPAPSLQQPLPPSNIQTGKAANTNQGFIPAFMNMVKSLFIVIIIIIAMVAIIVFYRRIKSKTPIGLKVKEQRAQEVESNEPTNVSEAVSSFVRHKIKKTS